MRPSHISRPTSAIIGPPNGRQASARWKSRKPAALASCTWTRSPLRLLWPPLTLHAQLVPTFEPLPRFLGEYASLTPEQAAAFARARRRFVDDLKECYSYAGCIKRVP